MIRFFKYLGLEDRDDEMSLDGMSCDSDSLAIQHHHEAGNSNQRPQSPDHQSQQSENNNNNKRPGYDADSSSSSRPSVIETANKAPHHVIECT